MRAPVSATIFRVFTVCASPPTPPVRAADTLTTVQFDATGEYLATGDKGGRIVVFQRDTPSGSSVRGGRPRRNRCSDRFRVREK